ncbi:hypothetical protein A1O1_07575 [Capronia coronata CBS 617.96]|uniref:Major facilitator superfamily (MFS) profile domain-containing protein n=1 Tax=Capronia coronata CBS 617.96 TaxID=1182541 RepID=W9XX11_9EURO|nr:uncharacterized protein A1O1_07575 [Capronia coronata CBS 617.96]EXJ81511.1 hypothetical protein A1O1_07575 [Capronia coronata CBS 617.96]
MTSPATVDTRVEDPEYPGTITLVDFTGTVHAKHSAAHKEIVLNPTPSSDPEDPLNWSRARKWRSTACALFYTWCVCVSSSACYSVFSPINAESGISFTRLNEGTGYMYLLFGWGLLLWQPVGLVFGRRGVYLISLLGTAMFNVWAGYCKTNGTWAASRTLIGFFGAPSEALVEITMADLWFTHERGTFMGLYVMCLFGGQLGCVPAGFINDSQGWPWVLFWCAILNAIGFGVCFFFMEETKYTRHVAEPVASSSTSQDDATLEKPAEKTPAHDVNGEVDIVSHNSYPVKSYWQKLAPFSNGTGFTRQFLKGVMGPAVMLQFPTVVFSGFIYGCYLCWFALVNATVSLIFASPPYSFKADIVGLTYIAEVIGTMLSAYGAGTVADMLSIRLAKRNKGVLEPEFRLWLFAAGCILTPLGILLYGVGAAHGISWVGLVFGMAFIGFMSPASGSIVVSYVVDCCGELSGEAMTTVVLIRNTMNFGFNYGVTPWLDHSGYQNTFIVAAVLALVTTLSFLIMIKWGKQSRKLTAKLYWRRMRKGNHI